MSQVTPDDVRAFLATRFADQLAAIGATEDDLVDDFDLLIEGVIDSLGLLELVTALESQYGMTLDFERLEAEDLTKCGPITALVVEQAAG